MALKHDAQGFLAGDPIDIGRALAVWNRIGSDVLAIKNAVLGIKDQEHKEPAKPSVARPVGRRSETEAIIRAIKGSSSNQSEPVAPATPTGRARAEAAALTTLGGKEMASKPAGNHAQSVAIPRGRDGRGRFAKRSEPGAPDGSGEKEEGADSGLLRSLADKLSGAVTGAGGGLEEADPTVKAFNEIAQPMARGYEMLTGGSEEKKQSGFLRRIFSTLTGFRKEETAFSKAANKSLKSIEEKPEGKGGGDGSGLLGMLSGLLSKIPVLGPMLAGGAGMLGSAGKGLMGAGKGPFGAGKGMLRRIPLLGALIGGIGVASDIYSSETDDSLTRRQKDERTGKAVGGFAGSVGGMLVGVKLGAMAGAIGGPIGIAIGGVLGGAVGMFFGDEAGQILGDAVGGWVSDLREADIPGKIIGAWETTTDTLKKGWDGALEKLSDGWKGVKETGSQAAQWAADKGNAANAYIKDKTGVDVKGAAASVKEKAVEVGTKVADGAKASAEYLGENTTVGKGVVAAYQGTKVVGGKISDRWNDARQYLLGASDKAGVDAGTVAKIANFESGFNASAAPIKKDGTKISSAHGYGQFIDGTWTDMINKYGAKYGVKGAGKLTKAEAAKFRDDKAVQAGMLAEFTRDNIEKGRAYGGKDDDANVYAFHNLGDKDAKNLLTSMKQDPSISVRDALLQGTKSDKERARVERVISGNKSLYGDGGVTAADAYGRMGQVMRRGEKFAADAREGQASIAAVTPPALVAPPAAPVVASISAPPVSVAPKSPQIADAPSIVDPLVTNAGGGRQQTITVAAQDAGQDLRDRRIAHIVTGGVSGT